MNHLTRRLSQIGTYNSDSSALKMQKNFLVYLAIFMSLGGLLWGALAIFTGLIKPSLIPLSYVIISIFNILVFAKRRNFKLARGIQILISLLLPFAFQASIGGYGPSGAVMLWAVLALVASVSFQDVFEAVLWFFFFVSLTILSVTLDGIFLSNKPEILPDFSLVFLVLNILLIISMVFGLAVFYVSNKVNIQRQLINDVKDLDSKIEKKRQQKRMHEEAYKELQRRNEMLKQSKEAMRNKLDEQLLVNQRLKNELSLSDDKSNTRMMDLGYKVLS